MSRERWFSEEEVRVAVAASLSYAEALRRLGLRAAGGNHRTIRKYVEDVWRISVDHFDAAQARAAAGRLPRGAAGRGARGGVDVSPRSPQATAARGGPEASRVRDV